MLGDLSVVGALAGGGDLGNVDLVLRAGASHDGNVGARCAVRTSTRQSPSLNRIIDLNQNDESRFTSGSRVTLRTLGRP